MLPQGLDYEIAAMQNIATALGQLDPAARARTLQWLNQRFSVAPAPLAAAPSAPVVVSPLRIVPMTAVASDEMLSVETLGDLFDARRAAPAPSAAATPSVTGMLHEFVTEFQGIAREWDAACAAPADADDSDPVLSAAS